MSGAQPNLLASGKLAAERMYQQAGGRAGSATSAERMRRDRSRAAVSLRVSSDLAARTQPWLVFPELLTSAAVSLKASKSVGVAVQSRNRLETLKCLIVISTISQ